MHEQQFLLYTFPLLFASNPRLIPGVQTRGNRQPATPSPRYAGSRDELNTAARKTCAKYRDAPPYSKIPAVGPNIIVGVHGYDFALQAPTDEHIEKATQHALTYAQHLFRHITPGVEPRRLTETLTKLRIKYSKAEAERLAIADANNFQFTTAQIQRDIHELRRLGSLDALIVHHNNKQKDSGLNETRVMTHLSVMNNFLKSWK